MSILKKTILIISDIIILYLSLILTLIFRYGLDQLPSFLSSHLLPFSLIFIIWLIVFYLLDFYRPKILRRPFILFQTLVIAVFISGIISVIIFYLFGNFFKLTPKTNLLIFSFIFLILDFSFRNSLRKIFIVGAINTFIKGNSSLIQETINYLKENPQTGYKIVDDENKANLIVVESHLIKTKEGNRLINRLLHQEINLMNFWDFYEIIFEKVPLDELDDSWFIENISPYNPFYDFIKRLLDLILSFICGLIFLPLTIIIAILVKLTSPGPIIYSQQRVGKNGKIFTLYKFRTMYEKNPGPLWTEKNDKRVTPLGRILRYTHFDEIPQLWNIIKGDLSFIGPRPERVELAEKFKKFPYYEIRHVVKPGLTGWAQINYRPSASLEEAKEKLCYDIYYVKNRSLFLDLLIILKTIKYIFTHHGQ